MFYTSEFEFDSFGNVVEVVVNIEDSEVLDELNDEFDECYESDPFEDYFETQLQNYEDELRTRIRNGEPIFASEISMYSDLFKDVWGIRPHMLMGWLTEYDNVIDDFAEIRQQIQARRCAT